MASKCTILNPFETVYHRSGAYNFEVNSVFFEKFTVHWVKLSIGFPAVHRYPLSVAIAVGLLYRQMLNSSASLPSQLPFPTSLPVHFVVFLPVTRSLLAQAMLHSMRTTCPFHFNALLSFLSKVLPVQKHLLCLEYFHIFRTCVH